MSFLRPILPALLAVAAATAPATAQTLRPGEPPNGQFANVPLELVGPTGATSGVLKKGQVIARQRLRAAEAVVLEAEARTRRKALPTGLALAKVDVGPDLQGLTGGAGHHVAWCDLRGTGPFSMGQLDCLADRDGDGRMDEQLVGWVDSHYFVFALSRIGPASPLPAPVPYRKATSEERPAVEIGYRACDVGSATAAPVFATAGKLGTEQDWNSGASSHCTHGRRDPADPTRVLVDAVTLKVTPGDPPAYEVVAAPKPGPIGRFVPGASLATATANPSLTSQAKLAVEALTQTPFAAAGPAEVTTGEVARGKAFVRAPARHAITGTLTNRVTAKGLFATRAVPLEPGQAMYGVPTANGGFYWCALRRLERDGGKPSGVCLPPAGGIHRWVVTRPPEFPTGFFPNFANESGADAPIVERGPAEIGAPVTVEYRLAGWNKRFALLELHVVTPSGSGMATYVTPVRGPDGAAELAILGGRLRLTPAANGKDVVVSVVQPLQSEGRLPY